MKKSYPTWEEWQGSICERPRTKVYLCEFVAECPYWNKGVDCDWCRKQEIPEFVAVKLGVKPKEVSE